MQQLYLKNQSLVLHPSRVIYWENQSALILSDLHFGKSGHFRKEGIAVPQNVYKEDLQRLFSLIQYFNPKQLIVAGDFFHSHANKELELFMKWRNDIAHLPVNLVKGNHDILHERWYRETGIDVFHCEMKIDNFVFTHDPADCDIDGDGFYRFAGHVHPGVYLSGRGKQSLKFPCFYFTPNYCILPAFSRFTGTYLIEPGENDMVYAIVNDQLLRLN